MSGGPGGFLDEAALYRRRGAELEADLARVTQLATSSARQYPGSKVAGDWTPIEDALRYAISAYAKSAKNLEDAAALDALRKHLWTVVVGPAAALLAVVAGVAYLFWIGVLP